MRLSLTGNESHEVTVEAGQGSLSIGLTGMNSKEFDVLVDDSVPINWECFNSFYTGHGKENADRYPFGDWPRFFQYWGHDTGFIQWSKKRSIERFAWHPNKSVHADLSQADIHALFIQGENDDLKLRLGEHTYFGISGNLEKIHITESGQIDHLTFSPDMTLGQDSYQLPKFDVFRDAKRINIQVKPMDPPFDCESLLQFKQLTHLNLYGNVTNLACLKHHNQLNSLELRFIQNLEGLPDLSSWKKLTSFIAWNVESTKGKELRRQLKILSKERELVTSSVSQLRDQLWFTTEYGIPFSAWHGKAEKTAVRLYKTTLKKLKKTETEQEVKTLLLEFTQSFNDFSHLDTTEREDIAEAIDQLRQVPKIDIDAKKAAQWFDSVRDY